MTPSRSSTIRRFDRLGALGRSRETLRWRAALSPVSRSPLNFAANEIEPRAYRATNVADTHRVRGAAVRARAANLGPSTTADSLRRRRIRSRLRCRASVGRASADDRCRHLRHAAHRIADGVVLPADAAREPARASNRPWTMQSPLSRARSVWVPRNPW